MSRAFRMDHGDIQDRWFSDSIRPNVERYADHPIRDFLLRFMCVR